MSTLSDKDREELSLLLPWYANGTLDAAESRRVEAALAEDEALAREFDLVLEDQAAILELVSEEEVPVSMAERFKAALHAEEDAPAARTMPEAPRAGLLDRLFSILTPRRSVALAALVAVLVPAVVIVSMEMRPQPPGQYQTASGEDDTPDEMRMLVKMNPGVPWSDVDAFLKETGGQIVRGPTADGLYELAFEEAEGTAGRLEAETGLFEFALPAN
ncbi:MAG: hypothetical protein RIG84_02760 [Roseovarius sp.]